MSIMKERKRLNMNKISLILINGLVFMGFLIGFNAGCNGASSVESGSSSSTPKPVLVTNSATDITLTSAVLNGRINPNGIQTSAYFKFGTGSANNNTFLQSIGDGTANVFVSEALSDLSAETQYKFKLAATNSLGTFFGSEISFRTVTPSVAPALTSGPVPDDETTSIPIIGIRLGWSRTIGASSYDVYFGSTNPPSFQANINPTSFSLPTLQYSTVYYWRVDSKNSIGTTTGIVWSFATQIPQPPALSTAPATNITTSAAVLNGTVNPMALTTNAYFEWGSSIAYGNTTSSQNVGNGINSVNVSANISGLSANMIYNFRLKATNSAGTSYGNNLIFTSAPPTPTCATNPAGNITAYSARLNGTVNPNGFATNVYFQYGLTTSYDSATALQAIGNGTDNVAVIADIGGLSPSILYNFRMAGINSGGTAYGNNLTFSALTTAPTCVTNQATITNLSGYQAVLNGTVNPNGLATNAYFQYGSSTSYGSTTTSQVIGSGTTNIAVTAIVSGFPTLYSRIVGTNSLGTSYGANQTIVFPIPPVIGGGGGGGYPPPPPPTPVQ
jgi:hypothetical protein